MSRQIQIRRGTTTEHISFTGALGEITMNTDKKTLCVHDGETVGGIEIAKTADVTALQTEINNQGLQNYIGTCSTASATAQKEVTISNFVLTTGVRFKVKFTNKNTAAVPTIKINSLDALTIKDESGTTVSTTSPAYFPAGATIDFYYDGTNAVFENKCIYTYTSGTAQRKIWANGWCEQMNLSSCASGGTTITLPIQMLTATYTITGISNNYSNRILTMDTPTVTTFRMIARSGGDSAIASSGYWKVEGYAA
jgi:hypothetical protein